VNPLSGRSLKSAFLRQLETIEFGTLRLATPEGVTHVFGSGEPAAEAVIRDWALLPILLARGDIGLGEAYVADLWDTPSVEAVTMVAMLNFERLGSFGRPSRLNTLKFLLLNRLLRANSPRGAARNIRSHYDVGNEFYQLWLDPGMTYSSALFAPEDDDLGRAQARKYDRLLGRLADGEAVLEIGCGWGGFAERAAEAGRRVTGITISPSQKGYADARLDGRAEIRLQDYRAVSGSFDNIVSIEMLEAVGERYWPVYFAVLKTRLAEEGRALLQVITVPDAEFPAYRACSDFIRHYTFPGGMLLCEDAIARQAARAGLAVRDSFAFGRDYARTCRHWSAALGRQRERIDRLGHGRDFFRSWIYYLETCATSFTLGRADVVQVELAHAR
jgi:cyclopropane-fatty-acyl-phospholipid synthase